MAGREPDASEEVVAKGTERSSELSAIVNNFILRRTNSLLSAHLPPKACPATLHSINHSPHALPQPVVLPVWFTICARQDKPRTQLHATASGINALFCSHEDVSGCQDPYGVMMMNVKVVLCGDRWWRWCAAGHRRCRSICTTTFWRPTRPSAC